MLDLSCCSDEDVCAAGRLQSSSSASVSDILEGMDDDAMAEEEVDEDAAALNRPTNVVCLIVVWNAGGQMQQKYKDILHGVYCE